VKRTTAFDGTWIGKETCESRPPFAEGYYQYALRIKDGVLQAAFGDEGKPGSTIYDGKIETDGSASITVKGVIGENDPLRRLAGSSYQYKIALALKDSRRDRRSYRNCAAMPDGIVEASAAEPGGKSGPSRSEARHQARRQVSRGSRPNSATVGNLGRPEAG